MVLCGLFCENAERGRLYGFYDFMGGGILQKSRFFFLKVLSINIYGNLIIITKRVLIYYKLEN